MAEKSEESEWFDALKAKGHMPAEAEIARLITVYASNPYGMRSAERAARAILNLFAPILAEKEREIREMADHVAHADAYQAADMDNLDRALAAEAALAGERERIAAGLQAQADALWERCEMKRSDPPSIDEQADAAQAFALQKAAAAIRVQGE